MPPASARDGGREVATGPATATKAAGEPGTAATTTARRAQVGAAAAGPGERGAGSPGALGPALCCTGAPAGLRGMEIPLGSEWDLRTWAQGCERGGFLPPQRRGEGMSRHQAETAPG